MNNSWHLAIDFGTSNSAAAHTAPLSGLIETLPLSHRSNLVPSAVYVQEDGAIFYGESALSMGRHDPSRLMVSPKRYIGHELVQLGGTDVPLDSIIAAIFHGVVEKGCAQHAGELPASITLTHPESWSIHNIDTLIAAALNIGAPKETLRIISEPRAAAMYYAAQQQIPSGEHVAVFDFGGGTLDIAVLRAERNGDFKVVAAKGDNSLGGRTIDNLLYQWVLAQLDRDNPDFANELRTAEVSVLHLLDQSIREAKEMLSDTSSARITISTPQGEHDLLITREEFNEIIRGTVDHAVELTRSVLQQARVTNETPIYMTGGSSQIPYVQNRLSEVGSVMTLDDPKTVVSRGALAATMAGFTAGSAVVVAPKPVEAGNPFAMASTSDTNSTSNNSAPPATRTEPKRKLSKPVIAAATVLAVLLVGYGAYALFFQKSTVVPVNTTAEDATIPLIERYSTADQFLPQKLVDLMAKCEGKADEYNDDITVPVYDCTMTSEDDAPIGNTSGITMYWVPGEDAQQARDEVESGKSTHAEQEKITKILIQEAKGKKPEVGMTLTESSSGFVYMYYPKDDFTLYFKLSSNFDEPKEERVRNYMKYLGVME